MKNIYKERDKRERERDGQIIHSGIFNSVGEDIALGLLFILIEYKNNELHYK